MLFLRVFPMLLAPFVLYVLFSLGGAGDLASGRPALIQIHTATGGVLGLNKGDLVAILTIVAMALDLGASANTSTASIVRLCLNGGLAVLFLLLLVLVSMFASASFLLLTMAAMLEFMIGAGIMVVSARRDVSYGSEH